MKTFFVLQPSIHCDVMTHFGLTQRVGFLSNGAPAGALLIGSLSCRAQA